MKLRHSFIAAAFGLMTFSGAFANCEKPSGEIAKILTPIIGNSNAASLDCLNEKTGKVAEKAVIDLIKNAIGK